jgi:hypothetical protein
MDFYSAIKNKIMLLAGKQMELAIIMLNEASQVQRDKGHMVSLKCEG